MQKILICEDNAIHLDIISEIISEFLQEAPFNAEIFSKTTSYLDVIHSVKTQPDSTFIYFLDIDLKADINGIELASEIRKYDPNGKIIFVSTHSEMTPLTFKYKVEAFDFIAKSTVPDMKIAIFSCLEELQKRTLMTVKETDFFEFKIGTMTKKIPYRDILFFETSTTPHKIKLHTVTGILSFYGKISELATLNDNLVKCHSSYLVNKQHIQTVDKQSRIITMVNGQTCPISFRALKLV